MKKVIADLSWRRIAKYAICLFAAQFVLGFVQGLLLPPSGDVQIVMHQFVAGITASLSIAMIVFLILSMRHGQQRWLQAGAVLLLDTVASLGFSWLLGIWLELSPTVLRLTEWLAVVVGALLGTGIGAFFARQRGCRVAGSEA